MHISVNLQAGQPVYEQIKSQIRSQIFSGELTADTMLPSIRMLAKELRVGIITAKRAYDDLCAEGFCYSVPGKGVFVKEPSAQKAQEYKRQKLGAMLGEAAQFAADNKVEKGELIELLKEILGE